MEWRIQNSGYFSLYLRVWKERRKAGGGEERPSSEVEILSSRHGEKITEHLLLSPTATKLAHRKQTQPVLRFVKWQQKLQANLFMSRVSKLKYFPRESGELTEDILVESIWIWAFNNSQARRKQFSLQNKPWFIWKPWKFYFQREDSTTIVPHRLYTCDKGQLL